MPEIIDPVVTELGTNVYNAARRSNLDPAQAKFFNQLAHQYKKGKEIAALGEAAGRKEFLALDPSVQANIRAFFPDKKIFAEDKSLVQEVLNFAFKAATLPVRGIASPFLFALDALEKWEKTYKTVEYTAARQAGENREAQAQELAITRRKDFGSAVISNAFDGKNNWQWEKVDAYEKQYGVALTTLARAIAEGRSVEGAIDLYGDADEDMMAAVVYMYDQPDKFRELLDSIKVDAQISPGRDLVNETMLVGKRVDGNYWQGVFQRLLGIDPMIVYPKGVSPESEEGKRIAKMAEVRVKEKVSGQIDGIYTILGDPITWMTGGVFAVPKIALKGVSGIRVGIKEAVKMAAFKSKGQRLAEQFKFVSENKGTTTAGYTWLFEQPEVRELWDNLGPRLKNYSEAESPTAKASILESIKFDYPMWYSDSAIKTLINGKAFDAAGAENFFKNIDNANLMLNGQVNGIIFRRNGIPYARKTRNLTSAVHRLAYKTFNPSSEIDLTASEALRAGDERVGMAISILTKTANDENKLLNPEIDDLFALQKDVSGARKKAYKLGVMASRVPGPIRLGTNAVETANAIRDTASLVLPKDIGNAVTIAVLDEPIDIQLTVLRNMQYAFMRRMNVPEDEIQKILQKTFNEQAGFGVVPDLPIADNIASQMHPMAVNFVNGQAQLAATGAIIPAQLQKGIKQLPFDLIYQLSAQANLDKLSKATPVRSFINLLAGATRSNAVRVYNNNWAAYTLAPRLGIRTNVDEGFFYYLTKPVTDILDLVASKFQKDIKAMTAVTGSSAAIGPWKGSIYWLANKRGWKTKEGAAWDPRKVLSPGERAELAESVRLGLSKDLGYEVPMSEVQPLVIKETILSRIEDILKVNGPEWENWKRVFRNNSNFMEGMTASMGARDTIVGKIDRDFFESMFSVDQLTLLIKELGLERSGLYTPKEVSKLSQQELGLTMWDNFVLRFGFNQVKLYEGAYLNPVDVFFKNNGLKNDEFFGSMKPSTNFVNARTDLMQQMGATYNEVNGLYDILDKGKLRSALSNFGETVYLRQKGVSDPEIARIYAERMLTDMRFAFHGSADNFNQGLYDLMQKKYAEIIKASKKPQAYAWSRAANNLTWKEFDEATIGFRPSSGYVNTRLVSNGKVADLDALKEDLSTFDKMLERFPNQVLEMMDRQVTGFFRLPAMRVALNKALNDLKPYENMLVTRHTRALLEATPSMNSEKAEAIAKEMADKTVTNIAVNQATDTVLEFVDNPNIRSNIALSIRHIGRFYRATEDFQRRVYRLYSNEGPRALFRLRLLHLGLENFGSIYEDENGDEYLTFPTDIVMNTALEKVFRIFNADYKVGSFNEFSMKFRLSNPSFAPDAGVPALAGPMAGLLVTGAKAFLRDLPIVSAFLTDNWEKKAFGITEPIVDFLDMFAMGHIGKNSDIGDAVRLAFPMIATAAWDAVAPAEKNRMKANYVLQGAAYLEAFGNGLPDNADTKQKKEYLNNLKVAASNLAIGQFLIGMNSAAYPSLKDSKGLPDFIKENGVSTFTSAFWDIYMGILKSDTEVANPFELAMATFIGKNPGKAVYTIPRTTKESRVFIAKTNELKNWVQDNRKFIDSYSESGIAYVFAPKIGEYNPDIYAFLESQGLVKQIDMKDYLDKIQVSRDKEKYFAIGDALNEKLAKTNDYSERRRLIQLAQREKQLLTISNPDLEAALLNTDNKGELNKMFRDLNGVVNDKDAPLSDVTRKSMRIAVDEVRRFIEYSDNPANRMTYNFSNNRARMKQEVIDLLGELAYEPAVKEATRLIFVPLMNKYSRDVVGAGLETE